MLSSHFVTGLLWVALMVFDPVVVCSQDYPNKPIRILTSAAGGGADFTARLVSQGISGPLGQQVIVDNRTSLIAADVVSKAPPDGYTLTIQGGSLWIFPLLQTAPYDAVRDFSPITLIEKGAFIVAVHPSVPVQSIKELIALAKTKPGELNYGAGVLGGATHLAGELFKSMASINMVAVTFKGSAPTVTALIGGELQLMISDAGLLTPHSKSGKLRALAVTSAGPSALAPGLPTVAAAGLPGYEAGGMDGLFAPAKTPSAVINRLNQEIVRFLNLPGVKEQFLSGGVETVGSSPEQLAAYVKADLAKMARIIKDAGIKVN